MYRSCSRSGYYSYGYSYGDEKSIDLSAFESRQLWPILDEAESIGLRLVYARKLGVLEKYRSAELCLDVIRSEASGALVITSLIRVDGMDTGAAPVRFIGTEGHGLIYVDPAEAQRSGDDHGSWRFRLARLTTAVPPQLQRMALENQRLEVPPAEQSRFRDGYYPRLRHAATVISSDGSFTPPTISDPTLVLGASYGTGHDVDVSWEWAYQVGDSRLRASLHPSSPEAGYRDRDAERTILANLDLPPGHFGLLRSDPASGDPELALAQHTRLGGIDTMRFTTELLPLLADQPGVAVEVTGDPADYREAGDSGHRPVGRRGGGRHGLVRSRGHHHGRGTAGSVHRRVRGAQSWRVTLAARRRRLLFLAETRTADARPADRGGTGAARLASRCA